MVIKQENLSKKLENIDKDNVFVVADFDKTISTKNSNTTFSLFSKSGYYPEEYVHDREELYNYYLNRLKYVNYENELQKDYITSSERTFYTFVKKMMPKEENHNVKRIIVDYIAGQTDKFFLNECGLYLE